MRTVLGAILVPQPKEPMSRARLRERASSAVGMIALSGFVLVGVCAAASISLWEVTGELVQRRVDTREWESADTKEWESADTKECRRALTPRSGRALTPGIWRNLTGPIRPGSDWTNPPEVALRLA